jgi:hypothetical protein
MEETNYNRSAALRQAPSLTESGDNSDKGSTVNEKTDNEKSDAVTPAVAEVETGTALGPSQRTYLQKLALFRRDQLDQPNRLAGMAIRPLIFVSFPVIFFAGFTYGANLVWFNVLNGMSSYRKGTKRKTNN